jgi:Raf kinase inhibitor-like YbhB/YbcL family protein
MQLLSPAFRHGGEIPARFTCDGPDHSPPLEWSGLPAGTRSLALVVEDPDAPDPAHPRLTYTHWVLYNIPPTIHSFAEALDRVPDGAKPGVNNEGEPAWTGPCPPIGRHRYFHRLYALDTLLPDLGFPTREMLLRRMEGHVLGQAELMATYQR